MKAPHDDFERDAKLDGLGVAFFAIMGALLDEIAEAHPDGDEATRRIRSVAMDMATSITEYAAKDIGRLAGAALQSEARSAINMVFSATRVGLGTGSDDGGQEVAPGAG